MIVVDASAVLDLILNRPSAASLRGRLFEAEETLHAPHLLDLEVLQVIRRYSLAGDVDDTRALLAIAAFQDLPIERYPHDMLIPRIWQLRSNFTAYDAVYVALAEALKAPMVTCDLRLAQACRPLGVVAEVM